ncbi:MAG TPA: chloride channel protein [Candidatus Limnocylindrales bacterium]|jgi:H+/Cl- antiporter ClcA
MAQAQPGHASAAHAPISGAQYLRLVALAAAIGIPAALVAALFLAVVHWLESWLWDDLPRMLGFTEAPWYLLIGLPLSGALIVLAARRLLPGDGGASPLRGLEAEATPPSHVPGVVVAALGTLPFGAILGPEMPVIALGSAVGVVATRLLRLGEVETKVIANAGTFSAISALFGGPLVAGMLLIEAGVGAGAMLIPALLPGLVAATVGYLIFTGLGNFGGLPQAGLTVPSLPPYVSISVIDLGVGVGVGITAVMAVLISRVIAVRTDALVQRLSMPVVLIGGGLGVGLIAFVCQQLGVSPNDVLFSGQSALPDLVNAGTVSLLGVLLVAKMIGYGLSLGSGYRGGPIFPAIFLGVALASVAHVVLGVSPTLAIAVGTAAGMAAQTRLLFSPLLFAALLVGSAGTDTLPAAVFATVTAWLLTTGLTNRGLWPKPSTTTAASTAAAAS